MNLSPKEEACEIAMPDWMPGNGKKAAEAGRTGFVPSLKDGASARGRR